MRDLGEVRRGYAFSASAPRFSGILLFFFPALFVGLYVQSPIMLYGRVCTGSLVKLHFSEGNRPEIREISEILETSEDFRENLPNLKRFEQFGENLINLGKIDHISELIYFVLFTSL